MPCFMLILVNAFFFLPTNNHEDMGAHRHKHKLVHKESKECWDHSRNQQVYSVIN